MLTFFPDDYRFAFLGGLHVAKIEPELVDVGPKLAVSTKCWSRVANFGPALADIGRNLADALR